MSLLRIDDLHVSFRTNDGTVNAVNGVSLDLAAGETLAIVGESGSGKSQTAFALMGLLARNGTANGSVRFDGREILGLRPRALNAIRAEQIAMIFQDPMTSLNPYLRISEQMTEVLRQHLGLSRKAALARAIEMLDAVQIPGAAQRIRMYPHEFSGGMRQRIMIAMALLCRPRLLIADEPTTALDVTVQAQIIQLLEELQREFDMSMILITHDLGIVAGSCARTVVLYGGRVMEEGPTEALFHAPSHPYTAGLLAAVPRLDIVQDALRTIPGDPPDMSHAPPGCPFAPRCAFAMDACARMPPLVPRKAGEGSWLRACHADPEAVR
ncbi:oligopeptide/dipeptide ABC transporter ATP-binding protein [Profundibacterium mesophilum]|uniref:ATP-binding protein of oligopetide ABC transporter n=1 Tax=Profundibacterium mesophilum KAUST100406-0324 TaxID=1037889 RepID=A0A921NQL4_9RHOB|nr:oligopeptide/dipeptide ABC transporter ATP-binding protein [Profundibacterium mesophilum]KAF0675635.1 ATP-binding protein of oligopetide ABC transporter [Profundibacterium mesophilum KAUST100406-0324]